jgi:hypothetical protein
VTTISWDAYQGLYFFNPFAENIFHEKDRLDDDVHLSVLRFASELLRVERLLERARVGTVVVTYHGLGGPIPSSYELVTDERAGSDRVRTWIQRPRLDSRWVWLEGENSVLRVPRSDVHCALASLICTCPRIDAAANLAREGPTRLRTHPELQHPWGDSRPEIRGTTIVESSIPGVHAKALHGG